MNVRPCANKDAKKCEKIGECVGNEEAVGLVRVAVYIVCQADSCVGKIAAKQLGDRWRMRSLNDIRE